MLPFLVIVDHRGSSKFVKLLHGTTGISIPAPWRQKKWFGSICYSTIQ